MKTAKTPHGQERARAVLEDPRWADVLARNRGADGTFVYAVRTTGVYCRPSCGARTARPENVEFHATPAAAERAGFRACKRCNPAAAAADSARAALIAGLCRHLEQAETPPTLAQLSAQAGLSAWHLQRLFKAATGLSPAAYARAARARRLRAELGRADSITSAIYAAGYNSGSRYYAEADRTLGMTASDFRRGSAGRHIGYAIGRCWLGQVLVAQSARGLCAVLLGDEAGALERELRDLFPRATLEPAGAEFDALVAQVVALVEAPRLALDLPLDLQGTAFQRRVWQALADIRPGTHISYGELARRLGAPNAVRAVAGACAANRLAVLIPCHRVLGADGSLTGYRWGLARKQALLEREAENP